MWRKCVQNITYGEKLHACRGIGFHGRRDLFCYITKKHFRPEDLLYLLYGACQGHRLGLINWVLKRSETYTRYPRDELIHMALQTKNDEIMMLFLRQVPLREIAPLEWTNLWIKLHRCRFAKRWLTLVYEHFAEFPLRGVRDGILSLTKTMWNRPFLKKKLVQQKILKMGFVSEFLASHFWKLLRKGKILEFWLIQDCNQACTFIRCYYRSSEWDDWYRQEAVWELKGDRWHCDGKNEPLERLWAHKSFSNQLLEWVQNENGEWEPHFGDLFSLWETKNETFAKQITTFRAHYWLKDKIK
jgi:hypothetical protein